MEKETPLDLLPQKVRYYLLAWKDDNLSEFNEQFGKVGLHGLTHNQLRELFKRVSDVDRALLAELEKPQP